VKRIAVLVLAVLLVEGASPTIAQSAASADLCLRVEAPSGLDLDDAEVVKAELASGNISVVDVVGCASREAADVDPILLERMVGAWQVGRIGRDPETGESIAVAGMEAESATSRFGTPIVLLVRCAHGEIDLLISWDEYLDAHSPLVMSQIGTNAVHESRWASTTDDEGTALQGDRARSFIESMYGETRFAVRTTPFNEAPMTAVFAIEGIEEALVGVRSVCDW